MYYGDTYLPLDSQAEPEPSAAPSTTTEFLTRCFLGAREEASFTSNEAGYDEDVNVYVVGLLERFLSHAYHREIAPYLHLSDMDLAEEIRQTQDDRHTFRLYKTNADHLLLAVGLFHHVEGAHHPGNPLADRKPEAYIGRGGTYYDLASSSLRRLSKRATGVEQTLGKLAAGFGSYAEVLRRVRMTYFHLTARIGEGVLYHLSQDPPTEVSAEQLAGHYDGFLDAYSAWNDEATHERWENLAASVDRLRQVDPAFAFALPDAPEA